MFPEICRAPGSHVGDALAEVQVQTNELDLPPAEICIGGSVLHFHQITTVCLC